MTIKGVDLLPSEKKPITFDPIIFIMVILIICSVVFFWMIGKQNDANVAKYTTQVSELDQQIKDEQSKFPEIERLDREIMEKERQLQDIKEKKKDPLKYRNILKEIAALMPVNLFLTRLDIEPSSNKVALSGTAMSFPGMPPILTVANLIKNFQVSNVFSNVSLSSVSQTKSAEGLGYTFGIDVNFDQSKALEINPAVESKQASPKPAAELNPQASTKPALELNSQGQAKPETQTKAPAGAKPAEPKPAKGGAQ